MTAQVGTRPKGGDAKQAPCASMGDVVRVADAPIPVVITTLGILAWTPLIILITAYLVLCR